MTVLYGAMVGDKLIYQSQDQIKAQYVADKQCADFVRVYIYGGAELTTFNLEPSTLEETTEYINRLVATINHLKEEYGLVRGDHAGTIAQLHHAKSVIAKLKRAVTDEGLLREAEAV